MDGSEAILSKQTAAALLFDNNSVHNRITSCRAIQVAVCATAVCLTHTTLAAVHGILNCESVYITVIRQSFASTYQAGS